MLRAWRRFGSIVKFAARASARSSRRSELSGSSRKGLLPARSSSTQVWKNRQDSLFQNSAKRRSPCGDFVGLSYGTQVAKMGFNQRNIGTISVSFRLRRRLRRDRLSNEYLPSCNRAMVLYDAWPAHCRAVRRLGLDPATTSHVDCSANGLGQ